MKSTLMIALLLFLAFFSEPVVSQVSSGQAVVPHLIRFGGNLVDLQGKPLSGTVGVVFNIYKDQTGGAPLWMEVQNVKADAKGHYSVLLGSTKEDGVPLELFVSGEAQWLGVLAEGEGQEEQARILLVSVPYALKAADADTLGGRPASAFMQVPLGTQTSPVQPPSSNGAPFSTSRLKVAFRPNVAGGGTANFIPIWTDSSGTLGNSAMFQSGGNIGIGTTTPSASFTVNKGTTNTTSTLLGLGYSTSPLNGNHQFWIQQWLGTATADQFVLGNGFVSGTTAPVPNNGPFTQFEALEFADAYFGFVWNKSGSIATALTVNPSTGKVKADGGVDATGSGIKHLRAPTASCTTGNNSGNTCNIGLAWSGAPFSDTNYTVTCSPENAIGGNHPASWMFIPPASKTISSFVVTMETLNSLSATLTGLECIAIHD